MKSQVPIQFAYTELAPWGQGVVHIYQLYIPPEISLKNWIRCLNPSYCQLLQSEMPILF